jgi:hypothetical protein
MTADSLIKRMGAVFTKLAPNNRSVYKRFRYKHGGDDLLGRPDKVGTNDIIMSPQPIINTYTQTLYESSSNVVGVGDTVLTATSDSVSQKELDSNELSFVLKDNAGQEEEFSIRSYKASTVFGKDIMYQIILKSKRRPE